VNAREEILARIRTGLGATRAAPPVPRDYRGPGRTEVADPVGLLTERLRDYAATVRHCAANGVAAEISAALAGRGATDIIVPAGFPSEWLPAGLVPRSGQPSVGELDNADGVLTTCAVVIATTGTIVLDGGPGQGSRAVSLVPDYHLVVVRPEQIAPGVPDAVARLDPTSPLTWISGPSATSDIELDRVEGVHGPRTLEVILITS
jgi:L-lactate dehydrogenase complex protein LldG